MAIIVDNLLPLFRLRFPEFGDSVDATVTIFLEEALTIFCKTENGVLYLSAHLLSSALTLNTNTTASPTTTSNINCGVASASLSSGSKSQSFKDIVRRPQDNTYITTLYGIKYLQFRDASQGYAASMFTV